MTSALGALLQRLRRDDAGRESDCSRVSEIHAAQLVAGPIQMRFDAAEGQAEYLRRLLIGLSARRPKQTLLFPDRQLNRNGWQFEIDIRSRINKNRQQLEPSRIAGFVDFPVVVCEVAGEGNEREHPAPIAQGDRKAVAPDTVIQGVGEESFCRRVVDG